MAFLIIAEIIFLLVATWLVVGFFNIIFRGFAPLVASRKRAIDLVLNTIKPQPKQTIYELGSGSARFLQMVEKKFSGVKLVGIEYSVAPFLIFSAFLYLKQSTIKIRLQNMFRANLQDADFIYCYLLPSMMPRLGEKIRTECKRGAILISYMFSVPGWEPKQIIKQGSDTIYFYEV